MSACALICVATPHPAPPAWICACTDEPLIIASDDAQLISTGISIDVRDPGLAAILLPRSGPGHRHGIVLGNLVGLIDSDFQGPLMMSCWNRGREAFTVNPMEGLAQLVIVPVVMATWRIVEEQLHSARALALFPAKGFKDGATGFFRTQGLYVSQELGVRTKTAAS